LSSAIGRPFAITSFMILVITQMKVLSEKHMKFMSGSREDNSSKPFLFELHDR